MRRYSTLALACATAVAASGLVNALLQVQAPAALVSGYGFLVLGKAAAFALLIVCGWLHRRTTLRAFAARGPAPAGLPAAADPRLPAPPAPLRPFLKLAAAELVVMAAAYGLAIALARTPLP
jgi:putative copper resistance protein D